jgi:hypothetical protein
MEYHAHRAKAAASRDHIPALEKGGVNSLAIKHALYSPSPVSSWWSNSSAGSNASCNSIDNNMRSSTFSDAASRAASYP